MIHRDWTSAQVVNPRGQGAWSLVCEHASRQIPTDLYGLGLSEAARLSHAAWDIGALDVAQAMSKILDAPLVAGGISRLVYDCNRPLTAADSIPVRSEVYDIPGNAGLTDTQKSERYDLVHTPFHDAIEQVLDGQNSPVLVTIHSFTPIYNGVKRDVELGFLYHRNPVAAQRVLEVEQAKGRFRVALNEPYAASDGVTYTLAKHGEARGLHAIMLEIRNDLIDTPVKAQEMAWHLCQTLTQAFSAPQKEAAV